MPCFRRTRNTVDQLIESGERIQSVEFLAAMGLCLNHDGTVPGDARVLEREQSYFDVSGQTRMGDVKAQVNRTRNLINILPARALRTHGGDFDFRFGNMQKGEHWVFYR